MVIMSLIIPHFTAMITQPFSSNFYCSLCLEKTSIPTPENEIFLRAYVLGTKVEHSLILYL